MCAGKPWWPLVLMLLAVACAGTPGPEGYLEPAAVVQREAFGGWIAVHADSSLIEGELIAVRADSVFVLNDSLGLVALPLTQHTYGRLGWYNAQWGGVAGWAVAGASSTISHGYLLLVSFPVWVLGGSLAASSASRAPIVVIRPHDPEGWTHVARYARFPQGMPAALDRTMLRSKPLRR
jgi:hypothetical protein